MENLENILAVEVTARDSYQRDMSVFSDQKIIRVIRKIKLDEDRHIALLQVLIRMLSKKN
jgi:rubrerythrin